MCLAVPSRVLKIENDSGTIDVEGVRRGVSFALLEDVEVGDYVIVHAGFAIQKIDETTAKETLALLQIVGLEWDSLTDGQ